MPEEEKHKSTQKKTGIPSSKKVSKETGDKKTTSPIKKSNIEPSEVPTSKKKVTGTTVTKSTLKTQAKLPSKTTKHASAKSKPSPQQKTESVSSTKGFIAPALLNNPATFSKAAFEEQVTIAIRESIARQKEIQRIYNPEITDKMKSIIANYTEHPELLDNIESNTDENFVEKLNIDSVDFVEIIVDAEEAFGIKMEDEEIKGLRSFDDLYDLIEIKILSKENPIKKDA